MPEAPDLSIGGWTGSVVESQGRGDALKYIVHWDNATAARVPAAYQAKCESQGLCTDMVCLSAADIEPALET